MSARPKIRDFPKNKLPHRGAIFAEVCLYKRCIYLYKLGSPVGTAENSPAIHCRGKLTEAPPSPVGTAEIFHCISMDSVVPTGLDKL